MPSSSDPAESEPRLLVVDDDPGIRELTADFVADVILGVLWYHLLVGPPTCDDRLAQQLVTLMTTNTQA